MRIQINRESIVHIESYVSRCRWCEAILQTIIMYNYKTNEIFNVYDKLC